MLLNFALDVLGTTVTCDKVSTDDHECTNLINTDFMTRRRGYISEHFVKPPVHMTFAFPCNVNISHILLDPYVGRQQSLQVDLLCATKPSAKTSHGRAREHAKILDSHQSSSDQSILPAFYQVSKITNCNRSQVCFYNFRFNQKWLNKDNNHMNCQTKSEMRHSRAELLVSASHVMVKIARTINGSTPAFGNVEIWGCVSSSVGKEVRESVEKKYISFVTPVVTQPDLNADESGAREDSHSSCSGSSNDVNNCRLSDRSNDIEIPEEFLDPLTCEVMTIPMILPSGKNVDKSSLDRFSDSEASHGRRPRDPFTGVEFSEVIRPLPNVDLKARIDSFLMSNSNIKSISSIPRTLREGTFRSLLGKRKVNDRAMHVSSIVSGTGSNINRLATSNSSENNTMGNKHVKSSCSNSKAVNAIIDLSSDKIVKGRQPHGVLNHCVIKDSPSSSKLHHQSSSSENKHFESHDSRLKDSLDSALFSILAPASSVKKDRKQCEVSTDDVSVSSSCLECGAVFLGTENIAYITPCSHLICRKCLLGFKDQDVSCSKCGTNFKKMDVVRSH